MILDPFDYMEEQAEIERREKEEERFYRFCPVEPEEE